VSELEETKPSDEPPGPPHSHDSLPEVVRRVDAATRQTWRKFRRFLAGLGFSAVGAVLLCILAVLLLLRFYGLPPQAKEYLLKELASRGVTASVDRLLLDPRGDLIAERVSIFRTPARQDLLLQVDHVRLGIAWFSWWRGRPLLQTAKVDNASINFPLTDQSTIALTQVGASVEFVAGGLRVRSAQARILNLLIELQGTIALDGPMPKPKRATDPEAAHQLDVLWERVIAVADDFDTQRPPRLKVDFDVATSTPEKATLHGTLAAHYLRWRGALVDEVAADLSLTDQVLTLSELRVDLARGELSVNGEADLAKRQAHVEFYSNLDFTTLASAFPGRAGDILGRLNFTDLPVVSGTFDSDWSETPSVNLQADVDWENFSYGNAAFTKLAIPIAFDGQRLFIPQAELAMANGDLQVDALYDRSKPEAPTIRARIDSTLDITCLQGVISPKADLFLQSLHFDAGGPEAHLSVTGATADPTQWLITGHGKVADCSYKNIPIESGEAEFNYQNSVLNLTSFTVHRKEGTVTGALQDDFLNREVRIDNLSSEVNIQEVSPALGAKFVSYVAPYKFDKAPKLKVQGVVDLNEKKPVTDTDLSIAVDASGTLKYQVYNFLLPVDHPKAEIHIVNHTLTLHCPDAAIFDGKLEGDLKAFLDPLHPTIDASLKITNGDFKKAMLAISKTDQSTGTLNLTLNLAGALGDLSTFKGDGAVSVDDGYILSIPFLGGLSKLVGAIIPGFGASKADRGKCSFKITDGVLHTDDLTLSSVTFNVIGNGDADFAHNAIDFDARVNVRGVMGLLLFPVSKLFEYHGSGTFQEPVWKPKNL